MSKHYPLEASDYYPRNHWYIAGFSSDFSRELVARTIFDEPLVFFRTEAGEPIALFGLCPHRLMPMEQGTLQGDTLSCAYHGYAFASSGQCETIPTGGHVSRHCRLKRYPAVERGPLVWIWMGDPALADPMQIPDASDIGLGHYQTGWAISFGQRLDLRARAALLVDNLFDLSHIGFIHATTIPRSLDLALIEPEIEEAGSRMRFTRRAIAMDPKGSFVEWLVPDRVDPVNAQLHTEIYNPGLFNATGPWMWESRADGSDGEPLGKLNFVHAITPETASSTHYFGLVTRDFDIDNDQLTAMLAGQVDRVRTEDVLALNAIEPFADRYGSSRTEISTLADAG